MFRKIFAALTVFLALFIPTTAYTLSAQSPSITGLSPQEKNCVEKMRVAVGQFVTYNLGAYRETFPRNDDVVAFNDLICADPEWMMNVVVIIKDVYDNSPWYGSFHIHFLSDGTFRSATSLNLEGKVWRRLSFSSEWHKEWCGFLKTVYPEDFAKQCEERFGENTRSALCPVS